MTDLEKNLLYLVSKNNTSIEDIVRTFDTIAVELLLGTKIVTPFNQFYFREIEFYFSSEHHKHKDPYIHSKLDGKVLRQGDFGEWYFHRFNETESFLRSTRNGVDITFGNKTENIFGGILIRKIQNLKSGEIITGINNVVFALLNLKRNEKGNVSSESNLKNKLKDIAMGFGEQVFDLNKPIHLENERNSLVPIFKKSRNDLSESVKKTKDHENYYEAPYCYFIDNTLSIINPSL